MSDTILNPKFITNAPLQYFPADPFPATRSIRPKPKTRSVNTLCSSHATTQKTRYSAPRPNTNCIF
ncbi:MAG TPA: hypothetical protein VFD70_06535 [Anaerolineae bacterium]|nr:hypothetical protein [Anaerolineae bacterium]